MGLSLEWRQGTIRFGARHRRHGDPYDGCLSIIRDGDVALLYAIAGDVRPYARELGRILKAEGLNRVRWERHRADGSVHVFEAPLDRWEGN